MNFESIGRNPLQFEHRSGPSSATGLRGAVKVAAFVSHQRVRSAALSAAVIRAKRVDRGKAGRLTNGTGRYPCHETRNNRHNNAYEDKTRDLVSLSRKEFGSHEKRAPKTPANRLKA